MNPTRVLRHAAMELRMLLRNGEQLLLAFAIPLGLLLGGLAWGPGLGLDPRVFPASVVAVATWSTAFTSLAVATGFEPLRSSKCSCGALTGRSRPQA